MKEAASVPGESVRGLYPTIEPYERGMLDVGEGNLVYWETCGRPQGKPAVVLHGGPGSGCTPWHRRLFDSSKYRVVLFDQRNCGRSTPHASTPDIDLAHNTTRHLIADIESLRVHLRIDRWLVLGGSWGSTLALAYAERHPQRVSEAILWGVTTGRRMEFDWLFRGGVAAFFPAEWEQLRDSLPDAYRDGDVVEAYHRLLHHRDPAINQRAARAWSMWESAIQSWPPRSGLAERFRDPAYALAFARTVTHYVRNNAWLEDKNLLRGARALAHIPAILINGRLDFQAPLGWAWELNRVWPSSELVVVEDASHDPSDTHMTQEMIRASNRFGFG